MSLSGVPLRSLLFLVCGCRAGASPSRGPDAAPTVALVAPDSSTGADGGTYVWYRVELRGPDRVDTLPGIRTHVRPVIGPDGSLVGLAFGSSGALLTGYIFVPATGQTRTVPLPPDVSRYFSEAALSPDGRLLAYMSQDTLSRFAAVVVRWPDGTRVFTQAAGPGYPSDVNFNHLRWLSRDRAEFAIRIDVDDGPWVHVIFGDKGRRVDSLAREPRWP